MNIAILSRGSQLYSTQSLLRAGQRANHTMEVLDPDCCKLLVENNKNILQYYDGFIDDLDAIVPRIGASRTYLGTSIVRHLEGMGVFPTVSSAAITASRDKWASFQLLVAHRVPVPKTVLCYNLEPESVVAEFNNKPVIIKLLRGTHGQGVILTESPHNTIATLQAMYACRQECIVQEYIAESQGTDLRAIVVDGTVVAAMKRQSKIGEFRSNLHRGGSAVPIKLSAGEERVALLTARALKMGVCGVDILQSERGPLVLEINSTPGLEGVEKTTHVDVSKKIIHFIERNKS
ncbi:MAG: ATP-grasp domain-containing protein [Marinirhabdus sp.]